MSDLKKMLADATPGPWSYERSDPQPHTPFWEIGPIDGDGGIDWSREVAATSGDNAADAALIVHLRNHAEDYEAAVDVVLGIAYLSDADVRDYEQGLCFFCGAGWEWVPGPRGGKAKRKHTGAHDPGCAWVDARSILSRLHGKEAT